MLGPGCAPIAAALSSAFVTGVTGGSLGQALRAGFIAGATAIAFNIAGGITTGIEDGGVALASGQFGAGFGTTAHIFKIASHAGIGCVSAMASGGKCGAGALSAGVSAGATPFYSTGSMAGNTAMAAVVGGLASKAGGGSFAEGATTAAFGYLFNQMASQYSVSASATGFSTWFGFSGSFSMGMSVPHNWTSLDGYQLFFGLQANGLVGTGVFAGVGVGGGYTMPVPLVPAQSAAT
jgi:hypothetical protein